MGKHYSCNGLAGCVSQRRSRSTGTLVGIYHAEEAGLDTKSGPWLSICEDHGQLVNYKTLAQAKHFAPFPQNWCEECQKNSPTL